SRYERLSNINRSTLRGAASRHAHLPRWGEAGEQLGCEPGEGSGPSWRPNPLTPTLSPAGRGRTPNTYAPEGASRCRAATSGLLRPVGQAHSPSSGERAEPMEASWPSQGAVLAPAATGMTRFRLGSVRAGSHP